MNLSPLRRSSRALAVSLGLTALTAQAPPPVPAQIEDVLPASTYACVNFGGLAACSTAAAELPAAAMVDAFLSRLAPEVREQHLDRVLQMPADRVQRLLRSTGVSAHDLQVLLRRPMGLAVGRLSIEGMGPSVALVIEEGNSKDEIDRTFRVLTDLAARQAGLAGPGEPVDIHGAAMREMTTPAGSPVFFGSIGGWYVVSNSRGYVRELIEVARGRARGLSAKSRTQVRAAAPLASLFVNTSSIADELAPHLPYETDEFADALGVGRLEAIRAATSASKQGGADVIQIALHGKKEGLLKALVAQPVDLGFASMCPADTVAFVAGSLDVPAVSAAFGRFVALLPAPVQHQLRHVEMHAPELAAMAGAFGPQVTLAAALQKGGVPKPELLLRVQLRDRATAAQLLRHLEAGVSRDGRIEWKSRRVGDHDVRFCNVELPNANIQVSPCYALLDTDLIVASEVAVLVRTLRPDQDAAASLAAQPDFAAMAKTAAGASGVVHLRPFRAAELGWRTVEAWAYPMVDGHADELGFGSEALPDTETIAKVLGTSTFTWRVDDDGITVRHEGAFAFGAMVAGMGALADEILRRASSKTF